MSDLNAVLSPNSTSSLPSAPSGLGTSLPVSPEFWQEGPFCLLTDMGHHKLRCNLIFLSLPESWILKAFFSSPSHCSDGATQALASCQRDFRNKPYPVRAKITYYQKTLTVSDGNLISNTLPDFSFEFLTELNVLKHGYLHICMRCPENRIKCVIWCMLFPVVSFVSKFLFGQKSTYPSLQDTNMSKTKTFLLGKLAGPRGNTSVTVLCDKG